MQRHGLLHLAYFSPLPPARSGVADYSRELLPSLSRVCELTLFSDSTEEVERSLQSTYDVQNVANFRAKRPEFDLVLYNMGNSVYHNWIYPLLIRYPGVVILHDFALAEFLVQHTIGKGDIVEYERAAAYSLNHAALLREAAAPRSLIGFASGGVQPHKLLIDRSLGIITHNYHSAGRVRSLRPERALAVIPALIQQRTGKSLRKKLNIPELSMVFASAGYMTPAKQIAFALRAFARYLQHDPAARYLLVGDIQPDVQIDTVVHELGIADFVIRSGFVAELETFVDWIATADVVINLRSPTQGETSAATLRALAAGKPVVVFDDGWYAELPDEIATRIPPLDEGALLDAMHHLASDHQLRQTMGHNAAHYAKTTHHPDTVASSMIAFISSILDDAMRLLLPPLG